MLAWDVHLKGQDTAIDSEKVEYNQRRHTMAKTITSEKGTTGSAGLEITSIDKMTRDASEVGMGVIMVLAALIGIWGIACLVGGIASSGGVGELMSGYLSAVTGR
jgi:hypothetical protein